MSDFECPYCGDPQEVCHDDGAGYSEEQAHEHYCTNCEKGFVFYTYISLSYEAKAAPCLNGEPHDFQPTKTWPKNATRMRCACCEAERQLTDSERTIYGVAA